MGVDGRPMVPPTLGKGELWAGVVPQGLLQRQCHLETELFKVHHHNESCQQQTDNQG